MRLLNRSNFSSSTKAKIRSCVNSKGKTLGCVKKDSELSEEEYLGIISSPEWEATHEFIAWLEENEEDMVQKEEEEKLDMILGKKF